MIQKSNFSYTKHIGVLIWERPTINALTKGGKRYIVLKKPDRSTWICPYNPQKSYIKVYSVEKKQVKALEFALTTPQKAIFAI